MAEAFSSRDCVMTTTVRDEALPSAPAPLPANWGTARRCTHTLDIVVMTVMNGIERTPAQFTSLLEQAGLKLKKIWTTRSDLQVVEAVLAD